MLAIAVVDDHPVRRAGLERLIAETSGLRVAQSVGAAAELDRPYDAAMRAGGHGYLSSLAIEFGHLPGDRRRHPAA